MKTVWYLWYLNKTSTLCVFRIDNGRSVVLRTCSKKELPTMLTEAQKEEIQVIDITGRKGWTLDELRKEWT